MRLPITKTLRKTFAELIIRRQRLLIALLLPLTLLVIHTIAQWNLPRLVATESLEDASRFSLLMLGVGLLSGLIWVLMAVTCHRVMLDDKDRPTILDGIAIGSRQLRYVWKATIIGLPLLLAWTALLFLNHSLIESFFHYSADTILKHYTAAVSIQLSLLPIHYLVARLSLCLPATALRHPMTLRQAFHETKGSGWRLTLVLITAPMLANLIHPIIGIGKTLSFWPFFALGYVMNIAAGVFSIAALSYSYDWFMNNDIGLDHSQ